MISVPFDALESTDLIIDAVYESDRTAKKGSLASEPLSKLLGVGNLGGFRPRKGKNGISLVVLTSNKSEVEWPDYLDVANGTYTYYGDNRHPGRGLHDTKQRGNQILRDSFAMVESGRDGRAACPLFLIFETAPMARDFIFRGLAVPQGDTGNAGEGLVAVWRSVRGERFQNYRATFTVLDEASISGEWLQLSLAAGEPLVNHPLAPRAYVRWVASGHAQPLKAEESRVRSPSEQQPASKLHRELLDTIVNRCKEDPWLFELVAAAIWALACPAPLNYEVTRRYRDGGRDAIGHILLGPTSDSIPLSFALEAKLYAPGRQVGVRDTSRLISRIKHREFGVFVTTASIGRQAYEEIRSDSHPIVILSGRDICETLVAQGVASVEACSRWLDQILEN